MRPNCPFAEDCGPQAPGIAEAECNTSAKLHLMLMSWSSLVRQLYPQAAGPSVTRVRPATWWLYCGRRCLENIMLIRLLMLALVLILVMELVSSFSYFSRTSICHPPRCQVSPSPHWC